MAYIVTWGWIDDPKHSATFEKATARDALREAQSIERSDAKIKFIDTPTEGRVDMVMLKILAEKEQNL